MSQLPWLKNGSVTPPAGKPAAAAPATPPAESPPADPTTPGPPRPAESTPANPITAGHPLTIVRLTAENVKRLKAVSIAPDGNLVVLSGRNGPGKSSGRDALT